MRSSLPWQTGAGPSSGDIVRFPHDLARIIHDAERRLGGPGRANPRAIYEVKRNDAVKHRWHAFLARGSSLAELSRPWSFDETRLSQALAECAQAVRGSCRR
jgi:hypothetical protein